MYKNRPYTGNISVVIPCYNEQPNIEPLYRELSRELQRYGRYEMLFVDDGSSDRSSAIIERLAAEDPQLGYIRLSRNFGQQQALKAGLDRARGDCVITMDGDGQHDPALIHPLIHCWQKEGYEVVYTLRKDTRKQYLKTRASGWFYRLLNCLSDIRVEQGTADFRLLDRSIVEKLKTMKEYHLFLRGLIPWIGFRQKGIPIEVNERVSGESKYTVPKMLALALHGITSFSIAPLRWSLLLGILFACGAFGYGFYTLYVFFFTEQAVSGWTSVIASLLFLSGLQLMMMGIMGEYIGKIFEQVKHRSGYIVQEYKEANFFSKKSFDHNNEKIETR